MPYTSYGKRNGTKATHYGIEIDSEIPITGVVQNNHAQWLSEEIFGPDAIDLAWEDHLSECDAEDHDRCWDGAERGDTLIGAWKRDADGKFEPDTSGEYAAIVRESVTQVVFSRHTKRVRLCSPCFPGQGDLDSPDADGFLAFDLPPEIYGD